MGRFQKPASTDVSGGTYSGVERQHFSPLLDVGVRVPIAAFPDECWLERHGERVSFFSVCAHGSLSHTGTHPVQVSSWSTSCLGSPVPVYDFRAWESVFAPTLPVSKRPLFELQPLLNNSPANPVLRHTRFMASALIHQ